MPHATHASAAVTPRARLRLARLIVDHGWSPARAAERYNVSWRTAKKWVDRCRDEGPQRMLERSSAPHHQPNRTPAPVVCARCPTSVESSDSVQSRSPIDSPWSPRQCTPVRRHRCTHPDARTSAAVDLSDGLGLIGSGRLSRPRFLPTVQRSTAAP